MLKLSLSLLLILSLYLSVDAANGCVRNTNTQRIYTQLQSGSTTKYRSSPYSTTTSSSCSWITTSSPCTISGVSGGGLIGQNIQMCPIDNYIWMMLPFFAALGYTKIKKKQSLADLKLK